MTAFRIFCILLSVFLLITGLLTVSNIKFQWMGDIAGYCAIIAGIVGVLYVGFFYQRPPPG